MVEISFTLRIEKQEVQPVVVGWCYISDYFVPLEIQCRYHIPLSKLVSSLFIDINHVKITLSETIWVYSIYEN